LASLLLPILVLVLCAAFMAVGMLVAGQLVGPKRSNSAKSMPYESGMDPLHDTRRRFDFRFHAVAVVFLVFDVELLFLYPWAVANKSATRTFDQGLVFVEILVFVGLLAVGFVYAWRRRVFRWH